MGDWACMRCGNPEAVMFDLYYEDRRRGRSDALCEECREALEQWLNGEEETDA